MMIGGRGGGVLDVVISCVRWSESLDVLNRKRGDYWLCAARGLRKAARGLLSPL